MTWDSSDQEPQPRAGLFGRGFRRQFTAPSGGFETGNDTAAWFKATPSIDEADMGVVEGTVDRCAPRAESGSDVSCDALADQVAAAPSPGTPQRHAQVLWEIRLPPDGLGNLARELATTKESLATALYPPVPASSSWLRRLTRSAASKQQPQETLALELTGTQERLQFFLPGPVPDIARVFDHLRASHEQLACAIADVEQDAQADPLQLQPDEAMCFVELQLEHPAILPLKTLDIPASAAGGDPLQGLLSICAHLTDLERSVRVVSQLVITPAPQRWKRRQQALLEKRRAQRAPAARSKSMNERGQEGLVLLVLAGLGYFFLAAHGLLFLLWAFFLPLLVILSPLLLWWQWRRWRWSRLLLRHEAAIISKLSQEVAQVCLRLYVIGPAETPQLCEATLDRLIGAYGAFGSLNRWKVGKRQQIKGVTLAHTMPGQGVSGPIRPNPSLERSAAYYLALFDLDRAFRPQPWWQRLFFPFCGERVRPILGMNEVAALWHLPTLADSEAPNDQANRSL